MTEKIVKILKNVLKEDIDMGVSASEKFSFGHYSSNVAFKLAKIQKKSPLEVARELAEKLSANKEFEKVEAVAPGFINFWLAPELLQKELKVVLKQKNKYGKSNAKGQMLKVNLEFVSANPTGPLTMANGRGGFYGDALANVLEAVGQNVTREYYVNDTGNQIRILGESILAALKRMSAKEEHYKGEYISILAKKLKSQKENDPLKTGKKAAAILLKEIKSSLKRAGIKHQVWFSEYNNLHKPGRSGKGELKKVLEFLEKRGLVENKEGAKWLGDGVLIKSDGDPTYFLADLAYHYDKFIKRKFDLAIDIWGADHHGYAARVKKGVEALGIDGGRLKILITQLVRLVSSGKEVRMSKRKGEFITMDDLLKEVGADAARFFFLMHSLDTHMDFDLDLAKERSQKNPVYYAQYAYARAGSILKKSRISPAKSFGALNSEPEIKLMLELAKLPDVILEISKDYQVHRLVKYSADIAKTFHNFYEKERVIGAGGESEKARLGLVLAVKIVLENLFDLIGISKPKKM